MTNKFKTADIRLHKNSVGDYEAWHLYQGTLYEMEYFETRPEARKEAVNVLKVLKENQGYSDWEDKMAEEDRLERERRYGTK